MVSFLRPGTQIPSADTIRQDLNDNFKNSKESFRQELQVNNLLHSEI
jgi:hypothetical protein